MDSIESLNDPPLVPLRRTHSLEFENGPEVEFDTRDAAESDVDIHAAAQLFDSFDVDEFISAVNTPVSTVSTNQAATAARSEDSSQGSWSLSKLVSGAALTETVTSTALEEPNADFADLVSKKPGRKSRKEEIVDLRESVEQLTDQVEALKTLPTLEAEPTNQSVSVLKKRAGPSLWKFAAMRQLERRRKAEEDNVTLREMLEMQVQEAKCLQRILKRRTKIQTMEDMLGMKRRKNARLSSAPRDNSSIFKKMLRDTDRIYAAVDRHFAMHGVADLPCPGQKHDVKRSIVNGIVFEKMQRNMLPFSLLKTQKAAWVVLNELGTSGFKRIKDFIKLVDFHAQQTEESRDTIATSYFTVTPGHERVSGAQVRKVMRMFIEEDRAVFVWEMMAEPKLKSSNAPVGYELHSTLQVVMRQGIEPTISGDDSTELLIHFCGSRHDLDIPMSANFREPGHLDLGIAVWDKMVSCIAPEVESMLIDEACGLNVASVESPVPSSSGCDSPTGSLIASTAA
ncbi:hypothetical protein KRP22_014540 [Phytophthora ramorum]|nr:hypothetical protein KRP22_8857 [Phytophthora ramorum]